LGSQQRGIAGVGEEGEMEGDRHRDGLPKGKYQGDTVSMEGEGPEFSLEKEWVLPFKVGCEPKIPAGASVN